MILALTDLLALKNPNEAKNLMRFFKTGVGQYGYGDQFLGIKVPKVREIAKKYYLSASNDDLKQMLLSAYHEVRLCALLMMVFIYEKTDKKAEMLDLYLQNTNRINNWDLVDLTAPKIIGAHIYHTKEHHFIQKLANSPDLWEQRIAIVAQLTPVKAGDSDLMIALAKQFLSHKHDLIQKATGWMLREIGKKNLSALLCFLDDYAAVMPRTMLRYAIEKLPMDKRRFYMSLK